MINSSVVTGGRGGAWPSLEIEICRKFEDILWLPEKLVYHQLKIIRFTVMNYFSTWSSDLGSHVVRPAQILL